MARGLAGEFDEGIEQKTASLKHPAPQVILQAVFYDPFDPRQRVSDISHALENDALPDPDAFIIDRIPDLFFVPEVAIKPALGETGGFNDAVNGGVEVALDREELHGFIDDMLTG